MANNILVIEENRNTSANITELLSLSGYKVKPAYDGIEGLAAAREGNFDLILCDVIIPKLDGYGVLRAVRNIPALSVVPFVFLTAKSEASDFRAGMDLGADDYLIKPFRGNELLRVVDARLRRTKSLHKNTNSVTGGGEELSMIAGPELPYERNKVKKLKPKQFVFMEGDSINFIYYLVSGKVKTFRSTPGGKEFLTQIYMEGNYFGYTPLMIGNEYQESAMTLEDSEIAMITCVDFMKMLKENNEFCMNFIRVISSSLLQAEEKLMKLAYDSARKRVAEALIYLYNKYNANSIRNDAFPAYRENIAGIAGLTPESVSRNLSYFKSQAIIEIDTGTVKILHLKKLESISD